MDGEYISDRRIETIVADCAKKHAVQYESFSSGWVHTFKNDNKTARLIGYKWSLNDSAASGIASDKVATYEVLHNANIPAIKHSLLRSKVDKSLHWPQEVPEAFVMKPLTGTSGHGVKLYHSREAATDYSKTTNIKEWAISLFVEIKREVRLIMLDGSCLLAYEKTKPHTDDGLKLFNLGKGAEAVDIQPDDMHVAMAKRAMSALGLRLGAVDLVLVEGKWFVLEVNDGFMMEHYLRQSQENLHKTEKLYEMILIASIS